MDYDLIVVKTLERVYKNYYYIIRGENKMLFTLVTKGKLDIDTAAEEAGVSVSEFEKLMSEAGYKVPETV
jgi:hypothetical protein